SRRAATALRGTNTDGRSHMLGVYRSLSSCTPSHLADVPRSACHPASPKVRGMNRRAFVAGLGAVLAALLVAEAQQPEKIRRIGFLGNANPTMSAPVLEGFRQGLRERGWIEGQNVSIEYRWADGNLERLPALASDLIRVPQCSTAERGQGDGGTTRGW